MLGLVALLAAASAPPPGGRTPEIRLQGSEVRVADLASVAARGAVPSSEASRIVARIPAGTVRVLLSQAALQGLVRRALPHSRFAIASDVEAVALVRDIAPSASSDAGCLALVSPVSDGDPLTTRDVVPSPCAPTARGMLRFDRRDGIVRAAADLPAGTPLGRIAVPAPGLVDRGAALVLVSRAGPVEVARPVTALQAGRPGGQLFVKDADGQVLAVPLPPAPRP